MDQQPIEILLVEDNPDDVELTLRAFKKNNIANRIVVVNDGEQALNFLYGRGEYSNRYKSQLPKVVLLDLKLPKKDGLEVLKCMKNDERLRLIPVVVLTSSREEQDIAKSYHLGVNSYIVKPIDFDQFVKTVQQLGLYWLLINEIPNDIKKTSE
jgi:two-component system, response regulator